MSRHRPINRLVVALSAAAVLVATLGVGGSAAANTRLVYFGSPESVDGSGGGRDDNGNLVSGDLRFTSVTVGGRTSVQVLIRNDGGQTLNHIKFAGGSVADALPYNAQFPPPALPSLSGGASFTAIFPDAGCDPAAGDGILCDVGSLRAGDSALYTIVITPPASPGTYHVWLTASWNEGWSTTGTNADYQFAEGDIVVGPGGCSVANYFLPAEAVALTNTGTCQNQSASIGSGSEVGGIGSHATLGIDDGFLAGCPSGFRCYGSTVDVSVLGGVVVPGGIEWTLYWEGIRSLTGVIHFGDDYATDPTDFTVIPFKRQFLCSASRTVDCWKTTSSSKGNANPLWFRATFVTPDNGKGGGFF